MLNPRKLKRNDVVTDRAYGDCRLLYGRVWKRYDEHHVIVIDCGRHVKIYHEDGLVLSDYKGYYKWQHHPGNDYGNPIRFQYMTGLRKLKKMAKHYNPTLEVRDAETR